MSEIREKLSPVTKAVFGVGGFGDNIFANLLLILVFPIYHMGLKLDAALIGVIMVVPRLWDAISDPLMGNISDNTRSKMGRRRPYMFLGAIVGFFVCWLIFTPPVSLGKDACAIYLLVMGILYYTGFTIWCVPYNSLGMELTSDYDGRSSVQGYKMFFISLAALAVLPFPMRLIYYKGFGETEVEAVRIVAFIYGLMVVFTCLVPAIFCRESEFAQHQRRIKLWPAVKTTCTNKPFLWLAGYIFAFSIGLFGVVQLVLYLFIYQVCGGDKALGAKYYSYYLISAGAMSIVGIPITLKISSILGKRRTVMMGICVTMFGFLASWFVYNPKYPYLPVLMPVLGCVGSMPMCLLLHSILADVADYDEVKTGLRREAMYMAIQGWIFKIGFTLVTLFTGLIIKFSGINPEVEGPQPMEVLTRLRLMYMFSPIPFLLFGLFCMWKFPITRKRLKEIQAELAVLREERNKIENEKNINSS